MINHAARAIVQAHDDLIHDATAAIIEATGSFSTRHTVDNSIRHPVYAWLSSFSDVVVVHATKKAATGATE
jgi:hypothetical protein